MYLQENVKIKKWLISNSSLPSSKQCVSWHLACKALHCYCNLKSLWQYLPGRDFLVNTKSLYFRSPGVCLCLFMCVAREVKSYTITLFEEIRPKLLYGIGLCGIPKRLPPSASHHEAQLGTNATETPISFAFLTWNTFGKLSCTDVLWCRKCSWQKYYLNIIKVFI